MDEKFWDRDPQVALALVHAQEMAAVVDSARAASREFRRIAEERIKQLIPTPEQLIAGIEAADIVKVIKDGLRHMTKVPQPKGAALNHHEAFGIWLNDWVRVGLTLHYWKTEYGRVLAHSEPVRVSVKVRDVTGPLDNNQLLLFPDDGNRRLVELVASGAADAGFAEPVDSWGGRAWVSVVTIGQVHHSYKVAAEHARATTVESADWEKVVAPPGWEL